MHLLQPILKYLGVSIEDISVGQTLTYTMAFIIFQYIQFLLIL